MAKKTFKDKFQRIETKYVISKETLADLLQEFEAYMAEDEHAYSTIGNLYYDTPTYQMIRESLEKPYFKEKLRVRKASINSFSVIVPFNWTIYLILNRLPISDVLTFAGST